MNDPPVLYRRPKASEMLQGMIDAARILRFEVEKFKEFYPAELNMIYYSSGGFANFENIVYQFRSGMTFSNMEQSIHTLREKGL